MDKTLFPRKANKLDVLLRNANLGAPTALNQVHAYLEGFDLDELILLLAENKELLTRLMDDRYKAFWDGELQSVGLDDETGFRFQIPQFMSSLGYLLGYFHFLELLEESAETKANCDAFFVLAQEWHSYHALNMGFQQLITTILKEKLTGDQPDYLTILQGETPYHGTPGYLLIANYFYYLSQAMKTEAYKIKNMEQQQDMLLQSDNFLLEALSYLEVAELLEHDSQSEIHNAYFGESLGASNPLGIDSIAEMKRLLRRAYGKEIPANDLKQIKQFAQTTSGIFRKIHHDETLAREKARNSDSEQYNEPPLLTAARLNEPEELKDLLLAGADVKTVDHRGNTALHLAVILNHSSIVQYLLEQDTSLLDIKNKAGDKAIDLADNPEMKTRLSSSLKRYYSEHNRNLYYNTAPPVPPPPETPAEQDSTTFGYYKGRGELE